MQAVAMHELPVPPHVDRKAMVVMDAGEPSRFAQ